MKPSIRARSHLNATPLPAGADELKTDEVGVEGPLCENVDRPRLERPEREDDLVVLAAAGLSDAHRRRGKIQRSPGVVPINHTPRALSAGCRRNHHHGENQRDRGRGRMAMLAWLVSALAEVGGPNSTHGSDHLLGFNTPDSAWLCWGGNHVALLIQPTTRTARTATWPARP